MNLTIITGNLGSNPEMRFTGTGQAVTSFSVATNRAYTAANGEKVKETTWFRVTAWGKLAEICNQYLQKGAKVAVEGRLTPDKSTGAPRIYQKQDGSYAASYELTATNVEFISGTKSAENKQFEPASADVGDGEDIPF